KTRGIWGEMQLSQILSELLTNDQYEENVVTKSKSKDPVEFAIKLPGEDQGIVRLPIDSKFPLDTYSRVVEAYESMDKEKVEDAINNLKRRIKDCAKDIKEKYIEPPYTTDFAIMFLPIEGLYAEVAKSGLIEELQNTYRVMIAGPTTMSALLNSLQVGFRTLAIQKRSSEVWDILSAVKTEFNTFGEALKKAQEKIKQADNEIEKLVTTRTNQIQRKLKDVTQLEYSDSKEVLGIEDSE
ncbi:MAG: DNA recombination protein RmuC, partial [Bacilli bacterium]|nr:DNA recombination protein RmuC [Bacilli bacterium]